MNSFQIISIVLVIIQFIVASIIMYKAITIHGTLYINGIAVIIINLGIIYMVSVQTLMEAFIQTNIYYIGMTIFLMRYERFTNEMFWQPSIIAAVAVFFLKMTLLIIFMIWAETQDPTALTTTADSNTSEIYRIVWLERNFAGNLRDFFIFSQIFSTRLPVFLLTTRVLYIIHRVHIKHQIDGTLWDRNGVIFIVIFTFCSLMMHPVLYIIGNIILIIGVSMILINNLKHLDYAFKIPNNIVNILVYNEFGALIYSQKFQTSKKEKIEDESLLSGYLLGITQLFDEALGNNVLLGNIQVEPFRIEFYPFKSKRIFCAIVSYGPIPFIRKSFGLLEKKLPQILQDNMDLPLVDKIKLKNPIDDVIKRVFPYL